MVHTAVEGTRRGHAAMPNSRLPAVKCTTLRGRFACRWLYAEAGFGVRNAPAQPAHQLDPGERAAQSLPFISVLLF
jgi:hypothetical protein